MNQLVRERGGKTISTATAHIPNTIPSAVQSLLE
jgi:hypothetical protein